MRSRALLWPVFPKKLCVNFTRFCVFWGQQYLIDSSNIVWPIRAMVWSSQPIIFNTKTDREMVYVNFPALGINNMFSYLACERCDYLDDYFYSNRQNTHRDCKLNWMSQKLWVRFTELQVTRSEQLSQQLQKELTNVKQKNKNEVWPANTAILCDGLTTLKEFNFHFIYFLFTIIVLKNSW